MNSKKSKLKKKRIENNNNNRSIYGLWKRKSLILIRIGLIIPERNRQKNYEMKKKN